MTSVTFWFFGPPEEKHVHKLHSMQTVADALQAISTKFKPALIPHQCEVKFKKQPVDLNTPFRLLNIPAGSKLEIIKSEYNCSGTSIQQHSKKRIALLLLHHGRQPWSPPSSLFVVQQTH
eukprot:GHRR01021354.1.p1 GENE.GHRR01021354.1~~GHRR01021354.1.p1  ORF type:complete len:120 (+),score=33.07 GHRR01021354.1:425-784(+)